MTGETPAWVLPDEPAPVRLMNTIWADTAGIHDDLNSPAALCDWLTVVTVADQVALGDPGTDELAAARGLRDALRRLAAFCTDDPRAHARSAMHSLEEAVDAVNTAVTLRPQAVLAVRDGVLRREQRADSSPVRAALAELAYEAVELLTGPGATTLRACQAPGCVLYFVKTHPRRQWCSEACGNRARAARHYQRIRSRKR